MDISKQQELDTDSNAIQLCNKLIITGNLDRAGNIEMFFITEEVKAIVSDFSKETMKIL